MDSPISPYGLIPKDPSPTAAVYNRVFGGTGSGASFDWRFLAPERERQSWIPFCVSFSRTNCAETLARSFGLDINLSDRELGVGSGTTTQGNTLEAVTDYFRRDGIRKEVIVPFTKEMLTYSGPDIWAKIFNLPQTQDHRYMGGSHSWVYGRASMIDALKFSPLQIALGLGDTWEYNGVVMKPTSIQAYHAVMLAHIDNEGHMYVQDSIGREWKKLTPDYPLTGTLSFRDLPANWKDTMAAIEFVHKAGGLEYGFLEKTTHTEVYHKAITEAHLKVQAEVFGVPILTPDGSIDFSKARDINI